MITNNRFKFALLLIFDFVLTKSTVSADLHVKCEIIHPTSISNGQYPVSRGFSNSTGIISVSDQKIVFKDAECFVQREGEYEFVGTTARDTLKLEINKQDFLSMLTNPALIYEPILIQMDTLYCKPLFYSIQQYLKNEHAEIEKATLARMNANPYLVSHIHSTSSFSKSLIRSQLASLEDNWPYENVLGFACDSQHGKIVVLSEYPKSKLKMITSLVLSPRLIQSLVGKDNQYLSSGYRFCLGVLGMIVADNFIFYLSSYL
jgi:hypothetical protein